MTSALIDRLAAIEHLSPGSPGYVLNCLRLPGRLNAEQTARLGGFQPHDIAPLVKAKLLTPLGGGARNCTKYFALDDLEHKFSDPEWLDNATRVISWSRKVVKQPQTNKPEEP